MLVAQFGLGREPVFDVSTVFATSLKIQLIGAKLDLIPCGHILVQVGHDSYSPVVRFHRKLSRSFMVLQYGEDRSGSNVAMLARENILICLLR